MTGTQLLWTIIKLAIMIGFALNASAVLTWLDRRQGAMIQDRVGPNRAVIKIFGKEIRAFGLFHAAADSVKLFTKEDFTPPKADKLLFALAPMLAIFSVVAILAAIPFGDTVCLGQYLWRDAFRCAAGPDGQALHAALIDGHHVCMDQASNVIKAITPTTTGLVFPAVERFGVCPLNASVDLLVAPMNVGILYVFAVSGQGIIGAAIAGWSSDNKFSLMGALRAASQMVSYEVTLGMSIVGAFMIYGTLRLDDMVRWQGENTWGIFVQPFAFFLFFASVVAESKRIPFDLPEAESELVSGYFTEYAGMKFGMFYAGEYMEVVTSSMLIVTLFLGGWAMPFLHRDGLTISFGTATLVHQTLPHIWVSILGPLAFFGKVAFLCWLQCFIRWTLPRFRYDQLMKLGWKILLPSSIANILVTGVVYLAIDKAGPAASDGLKVAADVTQAIVAVAITYFFVRIVVGFFAKTKHTRFIVGSSATQADQLGGTKSSPMQA